MGGGSWTSASFCNYSKSVGKTVTMDSLGRTVLDASYTNQDLFKARRIADTLNPKNIVRECCDSKEHPNTVPVILALDVTGSMGETATEIAKQLNIVMTELFDKVKDVQFCVMGIGDLYCDRAPIQMSQFESDVRIAEQLDQVYFEFGGGGNTYESYTAAWYMGARHTKLDCWKRGQKGIIITLGDEQCNPILGYSKLNDCTGDHEQGDVSSDELFKEASEKFDIYHINVDHRKYCSSCFTSDKIKESFVRYIDEDKFFTKGINSVVDTIISIVVNHANSAPVEAGAPTFSAEIGW